MSEEKPLGSVLPQADWPQELKRFVLPNFKTPRWLAPRREPAHKRRPGMDPAHLANVRKLPCTVCYAQENIHPHHLRSGSAAKERGIGLKCTDRWTVGLCAEHHSDLHRFGSRRERDWFRQFGIDPHALAQGLWNRRGNPDWMRAVVEAHKRAAIRTLSERRP